MVKGWDLNQDDRVSNLILTKDWVPNLVNSCNWLPSFRAFNNAILITEHLIIFTKKV